MGELGEVLEPEPRYVGASPDYTYFIQGPDNGLVKIGRTRGTPDIRFLAIQTVCPVPLAKLGVIPGATAERDLHRRFAHLREHGEWFRPEPDLLAFIAEEVQPWPAAGDVYRASEARGRDFAVSIGLPPELGAYYRPIDWRLPPDLARNVLLARRDEHARLLGKLGRAKSPKVRV